jgi:DNA-binding GntR family transcriptional regulator
MDNIRGNSEDTVYLKIKNAIRKRYIKQGSQLVEGSLAQNLGVSRTPVRSAIRRLEADGLVQSIPNRGAFVITPTLKEIEETFLVRGHLEQMAARLTAQSITPGQIAILNELIEKEAIIFEKQDLDEYYLVNDTFHLKIAEFSDNGVLTSYVHTLLDKTRIFLILFDPFSKLSISPSLKDHQRIVKALQRHDQEEAIQAVSAHIRSSIDDLETVEVLPEDYLSI